MERFNTSEQSDVTYFKEISKARNTIKSTDNWIRVYETWAAIKGYDRCSNRYRLKLYHLGINP